MNLRGLSELNDTDFNRFNLAKRANSLLPTSEQFAFFVVNLTRTRAREEDDESFEIMNNWKAVSMEEEEYEENLEEGFDQETVEFGMDSDESEITGWIHLDNLGAGVIKTNLELSFLDHLIQPDSELGDDGVEVLDELCNWGRRRTTTRMRHSEGTVEKTFVYRRSAIVLLHKDQLFTYRLILDYDNCVSELLKTFRDKSQVKVNDFRSIIKIQYKSPSAESMLTMLDILQFLEDPLLAQQFLTRFGTCIRKNKSCDLYTKLAHLTILFDWNIFHKNMSSFMLPVTEKNVANNLYFVEVGKFI